jgi:hypothetical protein
VQRGFLLRSIFYLSGFDARVSWMVKSLISKYMAEIGRRGGKARLKTMTPEERRAIATKASKAAAASRKQERGKL